LSGLGFRLLSATVLIAIVLGALIAGSIWVYGALALILGLALFEFYGLTRALQAPAPLWLLVLLSYALLFRDRLPFNLPLPLLLAAGTVGGLTSMVFLRDWRLSLTRWALAVGGSLYLGFLLSFYIDLYFLPRGFFLVVFTIASIAVGDTAAYFVGSRFGRHRFFPTISPKKTMEGAVAELPAGIAVFVLGSPLMGIPVLHAFVLGLLIAVFAEIGDLVESQLKRTAGVKDASRLIPGHGGVLDRLDSLLLVGVIVFYYLRVFQLA
jgi:phosphatidate cytidylyltransferase